MKSQLNRELIESLNESNNSNFHKQVNEFVYMLMSNVVSDISEKSPFITVERSILQPVNEVYLGAFSQLSEYDFFLGVDNIQIEMNTKTRKNFWKNVWREFRASWRLGRKKYKKDKKGFFQEPVDKYKITDFRHDVVSKAAEYLCETSIIYENSRYISMVGKDDFGTDVKVNIFICIYDSNKKQYKLYNEMKNKYTVVDFGNRFENLDFKINDCGDMFVNMVKIFNALFSKAYNKIPNQILVESLLYNCPNVLFEKNDVYKTFVNVANYIRLVNPRSIISICDGGKSIFEENLITGSSSQIEFGKIINMLDRFKY